MKHALAADLRRVIPVGQILDTVEDRMLYAYDGTSAKALPDVVAIAPSRETVAAILQFASAHEVPVVPRGAGTGLSGDRFPREVALRSSWPPCARSRKSTLEACWWCASPESSRESCRRR